MLPLDFASSSELPYDSEPLRTPRRAGEAGLRGGRTYAGGDASATARTPQTAADQVF